MNIILVSHCNYRGNSALHVHAIARELHALGHHPVVFIPDGKDSTAEFSHAPFPILEYAEADRFEFPDRRPAALIHAFTPRDHVRIFVEALVVRHGCPYLVHLEDNEQVIVEDELQNLRYEQLAALPSPVIDKLIPAWRTHPHRGQAFLQQAAGVTALMDRLLEFKPEGVPGCVFWPGFDETYLDIPQDHAGMRSRIGLDDSDLVLVYTGNVHPSNFAEVRSLILAIGLLRRSGLPAQLVKTGWNHVPMQWLGDAGLDAFVHDLGFLPRQQMPQLLATADVLVQPGQPNAFNDYRFPSKLPEFLASGRPVILPRTNIGRSLRDGQDALLLDSGDAFDIHRAVMRVVHDESLRVVLGRNGREFARKHLHWRDNVATIVRFYEQVLASADQRPVAGVQKSDARPPVAPTIPRVIAMYLPQFHPIPENDEWWGRGFTEWTNVTRAKPNFDGHYQPHLPADFGFYDLRLPEVLHHQAELARQYGIEGFCYYYYWFSGRRILERPIDQMLASGKPDMPFCICWANENWTRRWDGQEHEVLLEQDYADGWAQKFIEDVLPILLDPRYIRIDGAPVLLIYRANILPDVAGVVAQWREHAARVAGVRLHLAAVQSFGLGDPRPYGFDAAVEFPPHTNRFLVPKETMPGIAPDFEGYIEDQVAVVRDQLNKPLPDYVWYRGAMPSWDNTARRGRRAHILINSSPSLYAGWIRELCLQAMCRSTQQTPLLFVNAWNEWAEGTHLEPDQKYGHAWLAATVSGRVEAIRSYYRHLGIELTSDEVLSYLGLGADVLDAYRAQE